MTPGSRQCVCFLVKPLTESMGNLVILQKMSFVIKQSSEAIIPVLQYLHGHIQEPIVLCGLASVSWSL